MAIRVTFVSQDLKLRSILSSAVGSEVVVTSASDPERALQLASDNMLDAVILDMDLHSFPGNQDAFQELVDCGVPVIVLADHENRRKALDLVDRGAHSVVRNPPVIPELRATLRAVTEKAALKAELVAARGRLHSNAGLDELRGSGAQMQLVYKLIRKVANLDTSVLITGESGTGKELIARAIHNVGNRSRRPFVAVSCGAIPENLVEAELFGHEKGAFTGSVGAREGYFEKAGDGTLFLDEIGELNHATQVKLLRVLQQREFCALGSNRTIPLGARVVFATHRDLEQMVAGGGFRQDLFYRVNVMNIVSPALREHPEDIPALVQHFLSRYAQQFGKAVEGIGPEALHLLQQYSWPGNVRELENVMQRTMIMAEGTHIQVDDLPDVIREQDGADLEEDAPCGGTFERLLRDYKVKLASDAVEQCNGNKTLAAQSLSISRAYLHRLIRHAPAAGANMTEIRAARSRPEGNFKLSLAAGA